MINYLQPHDYQRSVSELLEFLLWCTCTAGKSSKTITPRFNDLIANNSAKNVVVSHGNHIRGLLRKYGIGQYERLTKCWQQIGRGSVDNIKCSSGSFLKHAPRDHLTLIHGLGLKTASFFIQCTRPHEDVAVLDVHILRWLQQEFPKYPVSTQTPQCEHEYARLEAMFVGASAVLKLTPAELDLQIWKQSSQN
jgi:thermostable 8-oxoguanine DNA glycosylase